MSYPTDVVIGVIGGSGVYKMDCLENSKSYTITTPFGEPSDEFIVAEVEGVKCAFIPRHGCKHAILPSEVNYRANIFGMKLLGVKYLLAITAVGSLREDYKPGDLALIDQLIDRTFTRQTTFFGRGIVAHVPFGHPVCEKFRELAHKVVTASLPGIKIHSKGTLVTMDGPVFSTKAESLMHRGFGADLIGMTTSTEAKLAREAEMAFTAVCMVTDMDAWVDGDHVNVSKVMKVMHDNASNAQIFTKAIISMVGKSMFKSDCHDAMSVAIMTKRESISDERYNELKPLIIKYMQ